MLRRNLLLILITLLYIGSIAGALHELDRAHYTVAKRELIRNWRDDLFPDLPDYTDSPLVRQYFLPPAGQDTKEIQTELNNLLMQAVSQENAIFKAQLMRPGFSRENEKPLMEVPVREQQMRKKARFNTWRTCLWTKDFEDTLYTYIREPGAHEDERAVTVGILAISWTTPEWDQMELLTMRYRIIAMLMILGITAIFAMLLKLTVLPLRRVSGAIEEALRREPQLVKRPRSYLERAYNDLARDALANRLQTDLNAFIQQNVNVGIDDLYDEFVRLVGTLFDLPHARIDETVRDGGETGRVIRRHEFNTNQTVPESQLHLVREIIHQNDTGREEHVLSVGFSHDFHRHNPAWREETVRRLADGARRAMESLRLHHASIFRQRSEASINLAENLGHDLTNIIATTKLDLSTLQQILQVDDARRLQSPELQEILRESVEHLLANSRFQQEIVNIYRAYTYLSRPKYETVSVNDLVNNIALLFLSSISSQVRLERNLAEDLPPCEVEPRLLKLACFNLLTNAVEAVKQAQAAGEEREPVVQVETHWVPDQRTAIVVVRDSGFGIRNERGEVAAPEEIEAIFRLGFTTKSESVGSGLGLSWVRSIVTTFHSGRIEARNAERGGAEFRLYLPQNLPQQANIL